MLKSGKNKKVRVRHWWQILLLSCFVLGLQNINICWWTAYQAKAIVFFVGV